MRTSEVTIGNTKVLAGWNEEEKLVHILDLDRGLSLTNALSKDFCQNVLLNWDIQEPEYLYEFICYHTDSTISKFNTRTSGFERLSIDDDSVDEELKKEMYYMYGVF